MYAALALLWMGPTATAQNAIQMSRLTSVTHGEQTPYIEFVTAEPGALKAHITCAGKTWSFDKKVGYGQTHRLELSGIAKGAHDCTGQMEFALERGEILTQSLDMPVSSVGIIQWTYSYEESWDRDNKKITVGTDRPLTQAVASFIGAGGRQVDYSEADLSDPQKPTFAYNTTDTFVKVEIEGLDANNFKGLLELFPYFYNIPHEDPIFRSGSHEIDASENPKLVDAWKKVVEQFELFGSVIEMDLYVAGYTDTQGDAASNQALSERRAKSLAAWFRNAGFKGNVFYQGFGESVLAVQTGDGVDEARNRRVLYFLSNNPPNDPNVPRSNWRKL